MKYRSDIDGLRSLAIAPVVLYHTQLGPFSGGFVGVDIFFVISGFLITRILVDEIGEQRFSLVNFYERRVRRIFPALFFMLFATMIGASVVMIPEDLTSFGRSLVSTILFVSNIFFAINTGYFDGPAEFKPLLHTWSLAVEEQFYLFFPLILILIRRWGKGRYGAWIVGIAAVSFAVSVIALPRMPILTFYTLPSRAWELMLGSLLAVRAVPAVTDKRLAEGLGLLGLLLIGVSVFAFDLTTPFPGAAALLPCLGAALLIYTGPNGTWSGRLLSTKPLVGLGLISYSLYLWHWPVIVLYRYASTADALSLMERIAIVLTAMALATFSWLYVEKPFRGKSTIGRKALFTSAAFASAVLAGIGVLPNLTHGMSFRYPAYTTIQAGLSQDRDARATLAMAPCTDPGFKALAIAGTDSAICETFGAADATRTVFIWGDSHAESWLPAFIEAARTQHLKGILISHFGCPPLLGIKRTDPQSVRQHCNDPRGNEEIIPYIEAQHPDRIVIVGDWGIYENGAIERGRLAQATHLLARADDAVATVTTSKATIATALPETVARLGKIAPVTVMMGIPTLRRAPVELALMPKDRQPQALITKREYEASQALTRSVIATLVADGKAKTFDPGPRLCADRCRFSDDEGRLLYQDNHHLNVRGASLYRPDIEAMLEKPVEKMDAGNEQATGLPRSVTAVK